jgi:hypothetical protein
MDQFPYAEAVVKESLRLCECLLAGPPTICLPAPQLRPALSQNRGRGAGTALSPQQTLTAPPPLPPPPPPAPQTRPRS